jgi:hypothetical protein
MLRRGMAGLVLAIITASAASAVEVGRLRGHLEFLASEALEGRLTGTPEEQRATAYVAQQFENIGLKPAGENGTYFQGFDFIASTSLGDGNRLSVDGRDLVLDQDWRPLAFARSDTVEAAPVAFAGYGIVTPPDAGTDAYDSYGALDVTGKWVMVLRYLPEAIAPEQRDKLRAHADLTYKATVARQKGAVGLIVVSGPTSQVREELVRPVFGGVTADHGLVAISITDRTAEALLRPVDRTLRNLQEALDRGEAAPAFDIPGVVLGATVDIVRERHAGRNVIGRLPGDAGSGQPGIVVGAHIDHLGRGISGRSMARDEERGKIHPGADDNASGVAVLIEVARDLAEWRAGAPDGRDVLFGAWSGEELGLLGSRRFVESLVEEPDTLIRPRVAAAINMDMVGRLREQRLFVQGVGSSSAWPALVEQANQAVGLTLDLQENPYVPSDNLSFYLRGAPVLNLFTGVHDDYHTPRDTPDKLNYDGMAAVTVLTGEIARKLAMRSDVPDYVERPRPFQPGGRSRRIYTGTIPDMGATDAPGLRVAGTTAGGPAAEAGLRGGDIIVELAGMPVGNIYEFTAALDRLRIGQTVPIVVLREGGRVTLSITPASRE